MLPSFKFVRFLNVCAINFSSTKFDNIHMDFLCGYLGGNPALYSVVLDNNQFSDAGIHALAKVLEKNKVLAHVSFKSCRNLASKALTPLLNTLNHVNMVLY